MSRSILILAVGALFLAPSAAAPPTRGPQTGGLEAADALGPELLLGHPALAVGDFRAVVEDVLDAVEREPGSPFAVDAAMRLEDLVRGEMAFDRGLVERIAALARAVRSEEAEYRLERLALRLADLTRFAPEPIAWPGDMRAEYVREWRVLGPLGPPDEEALALAAPLPRSPEPDGLAPLERYAPAPGYPATMTFAGADPAPLGWSPARRAPHRSKVEVGADLWPVAGHAFALAYLRVPGVEEAREMLLEVRASASHRVYWNGARALDRPRVLPSDAGERRLVPVVVQPGWNALLARVVLAEGPTIGARLLGLDGVEVAVEELDAGAGELPAVDVTPAASASGPPVIERLSGDAGPFGPALEVARCLDAGRPDLALVTPPPGGEAGMNAWRIRTIVALESAPHVDREAARRRILDLLDAIEASGADDDFVHSRRIGFDRREDRPLEALERAEAWVAARPDSELAAMTYVSALDAVDATSTLTRLALEDIVRAQPGNLQAKADLARQLAREGVRSRSAELAWEVLEGDGSAASVDAFLERVGGRADARVETLLQRVRRARAERPRDAELREIEGEVLTALGRGEEVLALARERAAEVPGHPDAWWTVAFEALQVGDEGEALEALARELDLRPADPTSRALLTELGGDDPAERFFDRFAPDREAAMERARAAEQASVVEVLDSGLIYVYEDGSTHSRNTSIGYATDRAGVEALGKRPIQEGTRRIRVEKADGSVLEPTDAGGEWVMPSLEIGDVVEVVWDQRLPSPAPGAAPFQHVWRFASFERAFPTSRWVVRVPGGLERGRVAVRNFDGDRRTVEVDGGVVHALEASMPRQTPEPAMPPYERVLPLAGFGADADRAPALRAYRRYVMRGTYLPADIAPEVAAFAREAAAGADGDLARAKAIYDALDERAQDFEGDPDPALVWQTRRGWPLLLFAAALDEVGIDFEWGVLETGVSPELRPHPETLFENDFALGQVILRLGGEDDPVWVLPGAAPGTPFGDLPTQAAGARVFLVAGGDETALPRDFARERFDAEVELVYDVAADGSASVRGRFANAGPQGVMALGQVRQATAQQRQGFALGQAGQFARGADITRAAVVLDGSEGPGLVVTFEGEARRFAVGGGDALSATLPFLPLQLTQRFGPVERRWPLEIRSPLRLRVSVTIRLAPGLRVDAGPDEVIVERDGFLVGLEVERRGDAADAPSELVYVQRLEQTALVLEPEQMQPFLARMADVEDELGRPLRLVPE